MRLLPFFDEGAIPYVIENDASLVMQGIERPVNRVQISIQWDAFYLVTETLPFSIDMSEKNSASMLTFSIKDLPIPVKIVAYLNEVIECDPYRILIHKENGFSCWVKHFDHYYLYGQDNSMKKDIHEMLVKRQKKHTSVNDQAWNQEAYDAWVHRFGTPEIAAAKIKEAPALKLPKILPYLGDLHGKKVLHLMGSHGTKAVAMAILGADVTVADISNENAKYATEMAAAAGITLQYIIQDVLSLQEELDGHSFDHILLELGVLHYFLDLKPLAKIIYNLLKDNGTFILHEFHPVSTKMVVSKGKKHKLEGNYFDPEIREKPVAFSKHLSKDSSIMQTVNQRYWTMGEMITAFVSQGLSIKTLNEFPNMKKSDYGIPKTYLMVCRKDINF